MLNTADVNIDVNDVIIEIDNDLIGLICCTSSPELPGHHSYRWQNT